MTTKPIHCDLLEIYGPDWANVTTEQAKCLVRTIHSSPNLLGSDPNLFGFVGTSVIDNIVGGFLAIQYDRGDWHYNERKEANITHTYPFERVFFLLFIPQGKLLLQNRKFVDLPLNMYVARDRFRQALDNALGACDLGGVITFAPAPETTSEQDFIAEFERSDCVRRIVFTHLVPERIPEGFIYYNPQHDRNAIIRESHIHDYQEIQQMDLTARSNGNLKGVHMRDLVDAACISMMEYSADNNDYVLRQQVRGKFELNIDMESKQVPDDQFMTAIETVRRERGIYLNEPTPVKSQAEIEQQLSLFDDL